jgi:hypothetical protein
MRKSEIHSSMHSLLKTALFSLVASLFAVSLSACARHQTTSSPVPLPHTGSVATNSLAGLSDMQGRALFVANCVQCHSGGGSPPGPNAVIIDSERLNSEESFRQLLRQPTSAMMKSFSEQELSDTNVHRLYTFLIKERQPKQ